ncbi:MAG: prephenate dehydrogenase [Pirellulaceae bacterium]
MKTWDTVAIVGVGLIGGSIGLALRERKLAREVVGIGRRPGPLRIALRRGAVTRTTTDLAAGVAEADFVVICTPVESIAGHVRAAAEASRTATLITDAGSTKGPIVADLDRILANGQDSPYPRFVGSHPMAGSEKNGPQHARGDLFEGCVTIVTPTDHSNAKACQAVSQFWRKLGARVLRMTPQEHDQAMAAISHLPHVVAAALAAVTPAESLPLAAGGWRDTTRIAGGDAILWRQILSQNRWNVLQALDQFLEELSAYRRALTYDDGDQLEKLLERGRAIRARCKANG